VAGVMLNRLNATPGVSVLRASHIELDHPEDARIYIQTDGESVGTLPARITTVPDALTLLIPQSYLDR
jgi:diacylglycerol kinase family enzyme